MADSFYVTLPSNSSMDTHPNNTLSHFFVNLPTPLSFEGDWEVALAEVTYPHRWLNVMEGNLLACSAEDENMRFHFHRVPEGYYPTVEELLRNFEPPIEHGGLVRMRHNKFIQKVIVKTNDRATLKFLGHLANLLGFDDGTVVRGTAKSKRVVDVRPFYSLFIYSNIVEYHTVGDTRAPLLRIINVDGQYGETVTKIYDSPHYMPLKHKLMDMIEIDIRDDTGKPIPFVTGRVIVKLHFRRKRPSYFN